MQVYYNAVPLYKVDLRSNEVFRSTRYKPKIKRTPALTGAPRNHRSRKSLKERLQRAKFIVKLIIFIIWSTVLVASALYQTKETKITQISKAEAGETATTEFPNVYYSADMPADIDSLFKKYFPTKWQTMKAICQSESGLKADSINSTLNKDGSTDASWCQINIDAHWGKIPGHTRDEKVNNLKELETSLSIARKVYDEALNIWGDGFRPWVDYRNRRFKRYLSN